MRNPVLSHFDLEVFKKAFEAACELFEVSKRFPREEVYSLTDQLRRSSRSVCANLAEAWRKRIYEAAFVSKINDSEAEAAEVQTWIAFALRSAYLDQITADDLHSRYEEIIRMLVSMRHHPERWTIPQPAR